MWDSMEMQSTKLRSPGPDGKAPGASLQKEQTQNLGLEPESRFCNCITRRIMMVNISSKLILYVLYFQSRMSHTPSSPLPYSPPHLSLTPISALFDTPEPGPPSGQAKASGTVGWSVPGIQSPSSRKGLFLG